MRRTDSAIHVALIMLQCFRRICVPDLDGTMLHVGDLPSEEKIKARLRELTEDSRKLREELELMIRHEPDRARSFSHDRPQRLRPPTRRKPK